MAECRMYNADKLIWARYKLLGSFSLESRSLVYILNVGQ